LLIVCLFFWFFRHRQGFEAVECQAYYQEFAQVVVRRLLREILSNDVNQKKRKQKNHE
jgi:hypothetical protein